MSKHSEFDPILKELQKKYDAINQDTDDHLLGLLYSKTMNYWDYIHTDALLNLQIQRTTLPDEMVFIGYHQINELIFKISPKSYLSSYEYIKNLISEGIPERRASLEPSMVS